MSIGNPLVPILVDPCGDYQPFVHSDSETGMVTSPNYPGMYPNNVICSWLIVAEEDYSVRLTVISFDLEEG